MSMNAAPRLAQTPPPMLGFGIHPILKGPRSDMRHTPPTPPVHVASHGGKLMDMGFQMAQKVGNIITINFLQPSWKMVAGTLQNSVILSSGGSQRRSLSANCRVLSFARESVSW